MLAFLTSTIVAAIFRKSAEAEASLVMLDDLQPTVHAWKGVHARLLLAQSVSFTAIVAPWSDARLAVNQQPQLPSLPTDLLRASLRAEARSSSPDLRQRP
jgi:hypothetical protein